MIVGRFSYIPQQKQGMSYVRISGQKEVYAVDGFLSMNITEDFNAWRDKKIMPGDDCRGPSLPLPIRLIAALLLKATAAQWVFSDGKKPDSVAAVNIIHDISNQNYGSFIDNFDSTGKQPIFTLRIEGNDFGPVLIKAYPADTANLYAIHSTLNPGAYFNGKTNGMLGKIFPGKKEFFRKDLKPLPKPPVSPANARAKK